MQTFDAELSDNARNPPAGPWWSELNRYHWFVLTVAALGWLFDTMDQQIFVLTRIDALRELLTRNGLPPSRGMLGEYSGYATSIFLLGWATGGLVFGVMGDKIGRAKTMLLTILIYSVCTGLSALSMGFTDFVIYRFLTGLGVGGEFAVGVSLVAEVMPARARPFALGLLQALSAVGNILAALMSMGLGRLEADGGLKELIVFGVQIKAWRILYVIGIFPAFLAIVIRRGLKEPERWQNLNHTEQTPKRAGSYRELFGDARWRRHAIVGLLMASSGVIGLWSIGFFMPDLYDSVLRKSYAGSDMNPDQINGRVVFWKGVGSVMFNVGAFFGIYAFTQMTHYTGRRPAFAVAFAAAMVTTMWVFLKLNNFSDLFWMVPLMGFCQLALFGGYAIYFPELFPTHLRSTGTSFCYNVGRIVAAVGPSALGLLTSRVYANSDEPMRWAGITMCSVFLLGLFVLPFVPETKGQPLPE